MRKRGWRVYWTSIACLSLCAIVFTISVFAATTHNVNVNSSIVFYHKQITASISVNVQDGTYEEEEEEYSYGLLKSATAGGYDCVESSPTIASLSPTDANGSNTTADSVAVTLQTTGDELMILAGEYFTISFTITPETNADSRVVPIYYSITYPNSEDNFSITCTSNNASGEDISSATTVTFKYTVSSTFCEPKSSVSIGSYVFKLANSAAHLAELG